MNDIDTTNEVVRESLSEHCDRLRRNGEHKFKRNEYVIVMIDGKNFSRLIKNNFTKPFDDDFISYMNDVALELCKEIQGAEIAFVQSDEISILVSDIPHREGKTPSPFFDYRYSKFHSIIPSIAASVFTRHMIERNISKGIKAEVTKVYCFDAKAWQVYTDGENELDSEAEVYKWFMHRQRDCIRNSKQQAAQTYLSVNSLRNKHTDEQIEMLKSTTGIDWYTAYDDGKKFGRFICKKSVQIFDENNQPRLDGDGNPIYRNKWCVEYASDIHTMAKEDFFDTYSIARKVNIPNE